MDEQQKAFMEFLEQKAAEDSNFQIDFEEVLYTLNYDLPMIPGVPMVQQVNPRPYKEPIRVNFGKLMPKEKNKEDKKGAKKAKAAPKKKDEKPPKPIKWAGDKGQAPATVLDLMRSAMIDIVESVFPQNIRQDHQNSGIMPTIIKEVFMPPDAPSEVATLIESSLVY